MGISPASQGQRALNRGRDRGSPGGSLGVAVTLRGLAQQETWSPVSALRVLPGDPSEVSQ